MKITKLTPQLEMLMEALFYKKKTTEMYYTQIIMEAIWKEKALLMV